jgi:hypothetical protein
MKPLMQLAVASAALVVASLPLAASAQSYGQPQPAPGQMSDAELRMRMMLMQRSMGFGGIFRPIMDDWMRSPSAPPSGGGSSGGNNCSGYSDPAARSACGSGHLWSADRLQNNRSSGAERDWYNR